EGVEQVEQEIEAMKSLSPPKPWDPPLCRTVATQGIGVAETLEQVREHGAWLRGGGGLERKARERARLRFDSLLAEEASRRVKARAGQRVPDLIEAIARRELDPYAAVEIVLGPGS
ncbi:MAG: hypothetical protein KGN80_02960, partial [Acidobacteriota bacterium]|nr:hypothetical protein [Acidobacteriota bacterium]